MYDMKALYQAASVEEVVALRLEHPEAQIIAAAATYWCRCGRASGPARS